MIDRHISPGPELYALVSGVSPAPNQQWGYEAASRGLRTATLAAKRHLRALPDVAAVKRVASETNVQPPGSGPRRSEEMSTLLVVRFAVSAPSAERQVPAVRAALDEAARPHVKLGIVGGLVVSQRLSEIARGDLRRVEAIALPLTLVVLTVAFLSLVAASLPLLLAGVTLVLTMAALYLTGLQDGLSVFVTNTASVVALGLGIDYSLFIVTRFREELRRGATPAVAVQRTLTTTGRAVALSGMTVALAMSSLFLVDVGVFTSMTIGGIVASLLAVALALTLLPAVMIALGPRLERLTLRTAATAAIRGTLWRKLADTVASRPTTSMLASLAVLLLLAIPATSLEIGFRSVSALPDEDPAAADIERVAKVFGPGTVGPVQVVTREDPERVVERLRMDPGIDRVWNTTTGSGGWHSIPAFLKTSPDAPASRATIGRLRERLGSEDTPTHVAGLSAGQMDLVSRVSGRAPIVVLVASVVGLLLLAYGLRSVLVPIKAVLGSLLSVGATLGVLLLLFPPDAAGPRIEFFVPLVLFALVFGLSLDYEVFLLSRVREAVLDGYSPTESVKAGLIRSARSITLAGVAVATVFAVFATSSIDAFRQLGVGVAVAVILDVTLVRCMFIPAATILFGRWNWWFPGSRATLPPLREQPRPDVESPTSRTSF